MIEQQSDNQRLEHYFFLSAFYKLDHCGEATNGKWVVKQMTELYLCGRMDHIK